MIFTDGSKSFEKQGAAFFDPCQKKHGIFKAKNKACIMTLELIAISKALIYAESYDWDKIVIYSDSKSAIQHLARCVSGHRGVPIAFVVLGQILQFESRNIRVRLQWVPSHIGIWGNEEADKLANAACSNGTECEISPCYSEVLTYFKDACRKCWKEHFDERSIIKGIWYKTIQCEPPRIPWFSNCNLDRKTLKLMLRIRSGHIPSRRFAFMMKKVDSPNCEVCGVIDDVFHILMECDRNRTQRNIFINKFNVNRLDMGYVQSILGNPSSDAARYLCSLVEYRQ
ncbi:hypothetical protein ABMA28_014874 [Loxostege sticticalis]|uniref:RNase H type-1 domain-containing protein n=1 Tax=Loxostege sticticalis TaxID=481309 RepID=A0ABD0TDJ3_LOXSC